MQMADTVALLSQQARNGLIPKWPNTAACRSSLTAPVPFSRLGFPKPPDWHGSRRPRQGPLPIAGRKPPREPETVSTYLSNSTPGVNRERLGPFSSQWLTQYVSTSLVFGHLTTPVIPGAGRREASLPPQSVFREALQLEPPHIDKPRGVPMAGKVQPRFNGCCKQTRCRAADGG